MIRLAHEMNIDRYHWGTDRVGYGPKSPGIYRNMFQHVVSLFKKEEATNVLWVFCPNAESVPNASYDGTASWNVVKAYYPGDAYVDVMGMDGYNWGTAQQRERHGWTSQWRTARQIFQPLYEELTSLSPEKPLFVFETGCAHQGGDRLSWIRDALDTLSCWNVKGITWFQTFKEVDWRLFREDDTAFLPVVRKAISPSQHWIADRAK